MEKKNKGTGCGGHIGIAVIALFFLWMIIAGLLRDFGWILTGDY